jgi:hypothetical protein
MREMQEKETETEIRAVRYRHKVRTGQVLASKWILVGIILHNLLQTLVKVLRVADRIRGGKNRKIAQLGEARGGLEIPKEVKED